MTTPAPELTLDGLTALQGGVVTRAQLVAFLGDAVARRALRAREWQLVHRGTYAPRALKEVAAADPCLQHRLDCAARILLSDRELVVTHQSAALLHGLRLLDHYTGLPLLTLVRPHGTPPAHERLPLAAGVPAAHREVLAGVPVTTRPRTVADLARTLPRPAAVVMADAALREGVDRLDVLEVLASCRRWPGVLEAIDVLVFASRRSESALESLARVWFAEAGLPAPQLQIRLCDGADGRFVARTDFFWPQHRTVCEVDGRLKYQQEPKKLRTPDPLWHEKLREDTLRDLGLEVTRGYWSDGADGGAGLVERVRRAFARGDRRTDLPTYGVLPSP